MTPDELKRACERAGLALDPGNETVGVPAGWWIHNWTDEGGDLCSWHWYEDDPALPAYVAEILAGMVRGMGLPALRDLELRLVVMDGATCAGATAEQRIRAAMEVLVRKRR